MAGEIKVTDCNQAIPVHTHSLYIPDSSTLEMAQKELAAHKEMVAELRTHLIEKEQELQVSLS